MTVKQVIRFTNDAGGVEKILRLLQYLSQVLAAYTISPSPSSSSSEGEAELWLHLRGQFALGRRYLRFFRFLECFAQASDCLRRREGSETLLGAGKWSFMGLYLMLESATILDAIGVWTSPWTAACMLEANRFWFYALALSIFSHLVQLSRRDPRPSSGASEAKTVDEVRGELGSVSMPRKPGENPGRGRTTRSRDPGGVKRRLLVDCFDLLIPGQVTGWIPASAATVGLAGTLSTVLSSKDTWDRLQQG